MAATKWFRGGALRLGAFLLLCGAVAARAAGTTSVRLGDDVLPTAQAVRLQLDPASTTYSGSVTIDLTVHRSTSVVRLHAGGETFERVRLSDAEDRSVPAVVARDGDVVTLTLKSPLAPGRYRLAIDFTQSFNTRAVSLYRVQVGGDSYLFTQFENIFARGAFPCFDEPSFKIPWTLTLDVPANDLALANMSIAREEASGGRKTVTFKVSPPMPSYLVALAVGPFETLPITGLAMPGRVVTVKGQKERGAMAAAETPAILRALEKYFGGPYPFDKLDLISVPEYAYGAMENPGAITFLDSILLVDPERVSQQSRALLMSVVTHELAHMWVGDLVTMRWWNDLWLNESFADWVTDKIMIEVAPELDFDVARVDAANRAMRADARLHAKAVRLADDCREEDVAENAGLAYVKGRGVLAMVESWLGVEPFRRGLLAHLAEHAWSNADADDLGRALSGATGEDVSGVLGGFMRQAGVPRIEVVVSGGRVTLTQERFHRAGEQPPPTSWRVPVRLAFADADGVHRVSTLLTGRSATIDLRARGAVRWLLPDADASGYYRWHLEAAALDRLLAARPELSRGERIAILGNLRALLDAGALGGDQWLQTLAVFANDDDPAVANAVVAAVAALETPFADGAVAPLYAGFVNQHFGQPAHRSGWQPVPGQAAAAETLRQGRLELVGRQGVDHALRAEARALAERWLAGESVAIEPALLPTMFELAARDGDRTLFDRYRDRLDHTDSPTERYALLGGLGAFEAPALAEAALDLSLTPAVRSSECVTIYARMAAKEEGRDRVWQWLRTHWPAAYAKVPGPHAIYLPRALAGCSAERLASMRAFLAQQTFPSLADTLDRVADEATACLELRRGQTVAVERLLRKDAALSPR